MHRTFLKQRGLKSGIQKKAVRGKPLTDSEKQRNKLISRQRFVVERTFGSQALWFGGKGLRYQGKSKAHAWHILQGLAYNLKRLPVLFAKSFSEQSQAKYVQNLAM